MTTKHFISTLAALLLLASCVCAVSAIQLNVGTVTLPNLVETGDVTLTLDAAPDGLPNGLSGYSITFTVADPNVAEIVGVNYPDWTDPAPNVPAFRSGVYGQNSLTIKVADVNRAIGTSATTIDLGSVTVKGNQAGASTDITVHVNLMDDDSGSAFTVADATGTILVAQPLGSIHVTSTPEQGADIFIDGSTTSAGQTDTTIPDIAPGPHTVKVSLLNYVDAEQTVTVPSGGVADANFDLVPSGTIQVTSVPPGAKIFIDNKDTLQVTLPTTDPKYPLKITGVAPGLRTVRVELDQYYTKSSSKTVFAGLTTKFGFTLTKIPGNEVPPYGFISVDSEPQGARIFIDGQDTQLDTLSTIQMDPKEGVPDTYDVKVTLDNYVPSETKQVKVVEDTTTSVVFTLQEITNVPAVKTKIVPRTLNLASKGVFVAFVTLPSGYKAADVNAKSVICNGAPAIRVLSTKWFPRTFVAIFSRQKLSGVQTGEKVPFTVTGIIKDPSVQFSGTDFIKVISKKGTPKEDIDDVEKMTPDQVFTKFYTG